MYIRILPQRLPSVYLSNVLYNILTHLQHSRLASLHRISAHASHPSHIHTCKSRFHPPSHTISQPDDLGILVRRPHL
jgi:hypothetical protein